MPCCACTIKGPRNFLGKAGLNGTLYCSPLSDGVGADAGGLSRGAEGAPVQSFGAMLTRGGGSALIRLSDEAAQPPSEA